MLLGLEADGGVELLGVGQVGELEVADHDALIGDPEAHAARQVVVGEEGLERLGEALDVGDLAVAHDAGVERAGGRTLDRHRAVDADLGGGEIAGLDVESDHTASCA